MHAAVFRARLRWCFRRVNRVRSVSRNSERLPDEQPHLFWRPAPDAGQQTTVEKLRLRALTYPALKEQMQRMNCVAGGNENGRRRLLPNGIPSGYSSLEKGKTKKKQIPSRMGRIKRNFVLKLSINSVKQSHLCR